MRYSPLVLAFAAFSVVSAQDINYDSTHNLTTIIGTWSSGAQNVVTGSGFVNPANESFIYPATSGISYSFDENYNYEIARYRFVSNATDPSCITGVVNWVHGKYSLLGNGSIIFTPFGDGFQQIQDACAAVSNFVENYNDTEIAQSWRIFQQTNGQYKLHIFTYDGSPLAPQFQVSATPIMLPAQPLRNVTPATTVLNVQRRGENGAQAGMRVLGATVIAGLFAVMAIVL